MDKLILDTIHRAQQLLMVLIALACNCLLCGYSAANDSEPGNAELLIVQQQLDIRQHGGNGLDYYLDHTLPDNSTTTFANGVHNTEDSAPLQQTILKTALQSTLIAMIIMAAMCSLALFIQHPQDRTTLWLMLICCSAAVFFFSISGLLEGLLTNAALWTHAWQIKLTFIALSGVTTSLLMLYAYNYPDYIQHSALKANGYFSLLCIALLTSVPVSAIAAMTTPFIIYWILQGIAALWILSRASVDRKIYSKLMLIAITPLALSVPLSVYQHTASMDTPLASLYCFIFFIFIESQIIGRKFSYALKLADKLSKNLKQEVDLQTDKLSRQNKKLENAQRALQSANESLKKLSITDGLTRVYNRMYFAKEFRKEWRRCARQSTQISILMIDVDNFKALNDSAGHLAGDQALQTIAKELHNHFKRAGELVARYGGEEFIVMLPETDQRKSLVIAEGLRHTIENLAIEYNGCTYSVTISIGISTTIPSVNLSPDHLLEAADSALYKAKNTGRNRVEIVPLLPSGTQSNQRVKQLKLP